MGLTGTIPEWGASINDAHETYCECYNLTGTIPAWNSLITSAQKTYYLCSKLTGSVPAWNDKITTAYQTYFNCASLTGSIPAWGSAITNATQTYQFCLGLDDVWRVDGQVPSDSELMPSKITSKTNCVGYTTDALRAYFLTTWGGTRAS